VAGTVFGSSVLIDAVLGEAIVELERALKGGNGVVPPLVVAELVTGARTVAERAAIGDLLQELSIHDTPLDHWIAVGELRQRLKRSGITATIPDAHIAQCALDRDAVLLNRDAIFRRMARHIPLRVVAG